jgi:L,D-peptidoglycan transpeptidase YkuD (ErfK/YbiS/YcfS/YnhG family)
MMMAVLTLTVDMAAARDVRQLGAGHLVIVTTPDWNATQGTLRTFEWNGTTWRARAAAVPITIGRSGSAWGVGLHEPQPGLQKREGDGRSPAGIFTIGTAFGYAERLAAKFPYRPMTQFDYCIDVNESPLYNQIVDQRVVGKEAVERSTEPMRRDVHAKGDQRYKLGFVIEHNPKNVNAGGSCIFAHLWNAPGQTTAGCTAMAEPAMRSLVDWLDPTQRPLFVLLPEAEYSRLRSNWGLPQLESSSR